MVFLRSIFFCLSSSIFQFQSIPLCKYLFLPYFLSLSISKSVQMELRTRWWNRRTLRSLLSWEDQKSQLLNNHWFKTDWNLPKKIFYIQRHREQNHNKTAGGAHSLHNQIPYPLGGWPANWHQLQKPPTGAEFWISHQPPQSGDLASGGRLGLERRSSTGLQDSTLGGHTWVLCYQDSGQSSDFKGAWARPT